MLADGEQDTLGFQCRNGAFAATQIKDESGAASNVFAPMWVASTGLLAASMFALL